MKVIFNKIAFGFLVIFAFKFLVQLILFCAKIKTDYLSCNFYICKGIIKDLIVIYIYFIDCNSYEA